MIHLREICTKIPDYTMQLDLTALSRADLVDKVLRQSWLCSCLLSKKSSKKIQGVYNFWRRILLKIFSIQHLKVVKKVYLAPSPDYKSKKIVGKPKALEMECIAVIHDQSCSNGKSISCDYKVGN